MPFPLIAAGAALITAALWPRESPSRMGSTQSAPPPSPMPVSPGTPIPVNLTGYCPYAAKTAAEREMEGAPVDIRDRPIITLQMHAADPVIYPYVSLSGDVISKVNPNGRFPYGQRVIIPQLGTPSAAWRKRTGQQWYIGRLVDVGSHFMGPIYDATDGRPVPKFTRSNPHKVIRAKMPDGRLVEPFDVAVDQCRGSGFGGKLGMALIVDGDRL